jgi:hypothetical protein
MAPTKSAVSTTTRVQSESQFQNLSELDTTHSHTHTVLVSSAAVAHTMIGHLDPIQHDRPGVASFQPGRSRIGAGLPPQAS